MDGQLSTAFAWHPIRQLKCGGARKYGADAGGGLRETASRDRGEGSQALCGARLSRCVDLRSCESLQDVEIADLSLLSFERRHPLRCHAFPCRCAVESSRCDCGATDAAAGKAAGTHP